MTVYRLPITEYASTALFFGRPFRSRSLSPRRCLGLCFAVSCGRPAAVATTPAPAPSTDACALGHDSLPMPEQLSIAMSGGVDPSHVPAPTNDAERFVFRQVYETLVRLDCAGELRPGLAQSWRPAEDGHRWTFTLRPGARFSDGTAATAQDVVDAWSARLASLPVGAELSTGSERDVEVRLSRPMTVPWLFADPALSVTRPVAGGDWPAGTGAYAADTTAGRVTVAPFGATGRPVLVLRANGSGDARDLLDAGIDLLVTDDAAALSYAASRSEFVTVGLPWERTYVLAVPGDAISVDAPLRAGLARDAVRVDARPAAAPLWWSDPGALSCGLEPPPGAGPIVSGPTADAIVYPRDDAPARDLTGRLVALGIGGGVSALRATGLGPAEFAAALASGRAAAYVVVLPRTTLEPCAALRTLIARAPWLADGPARHLTPLVDARRRAIVRRGAAAFTMDWDGTLRVQ
jgi:hypothetical protein